MYLVAFALLLLLYEYYLDRYWGYRGYVANPDGVKIIIAVCFIAFFVWMTPSQASVRSFFLNVALSSFFLPSMAIYAYGGRPTSEAAVIWLAFAIVYVVSAVPVPLFTPAKVSAKMLMRGIALGSIVLIISFYFFGGFRNFNLDISKVYDFRREVSESLPGIYGYLSPIFSSILIPFGVAVSIHYRKYIYTLLFAILSIILFGLTSHKSVLFSPIIVSSIYIFISIYNRYTVIMYMYIISLLLGLFATYMINIYGSENIWGTYLSLIIRRSIVVPPFLSYLYIEFFSENQVYFYWAGSRLTLGFVDMPYEVGAAFLIAESFFGNLDQSANTGFIGSGFAQAGLTGVVVYSIGVGLIFAIFQTYGRHLGVPFLAAVMIVQTRSMIGSTDFVTLFLTHGMLISLVMLALVPSQNAQPKQRHPLTNDLALPRGTRARMSELG